MAVRATDDLRIDWANDGTWTGTGENVTTRLLSRAGVTVSFGRDQIRALSPSPVAGEISFELDNRSKDYSPEFSGPIAANLKPGRPVRYQRTYSAQTYTLFRGYLDEFEVLPNREERSVQFKGVDALARSTDVKLSTQLYEGIRTGAAIGYILDAIGWPSGDRDLDTGATVIPYWWEEDTTWLEALQKVVASEGPPALVYIDYATNKLVFRDRHHRLIRTASTTSQATFRDTGTEPKFSGPVRYDAGWRDIINDVSFEVPERRAEGRLSNVFEDEGAISLGASASTVLHVQATDPFKDAVAPVADIDYTLISGSISSLTLSRTSGQSTIITITAGAGGANIDGMRVRAYSLPVARTYRIAASDSASITDHGSRAMPAELEPVWAGRHDAKGIADLLVLERKQRRPIFELVVKGAAHDTRLIQCLSRALSDRVTVVDAETGLNDVFYVERITHTITEAGVFHETTFGLEKVSPNEPTGPFIVGTSLLNGANPLAY
jgi:hypothetical protein